ncbi:MAG TPA: hypothetical protein VNX68_15085, partial [Nitrosopumilaceae archaeon]|nr:hypothetical protein [Nitrosopumilaceae archaeon]
GTTRVIEMARSAQNSNVNTVGNSTNVVSGTVFKVQWKVDSGTATISGRTFSIFGTQTSNVL